MLGLFPGLDMGAEPVVVFDLNPALHRDLKDERQRKQYWDEVQLVSALEGLVNRDQPRLFVRFLKNPDDFWWGEMTKPGSWLASREVVHVNTVDELLTRFRQYYRGAVVWDERVPATSDAAATVAGCDDLLPLRFDTHRDSLYSRVTAGADALPVKVRIPVFTGKGTILGTTALSTGSAKCDCYVWLIANYLQTGKVNPLCLGYYPDAFWLKCWNASGPENNCLCNHDYIIARRGLIFDLDPWDDESPVDDRAQKPGTDAATLKKILRAAYDRTEGKNIIDVNGFVPWAFKYTDFSGRGWSAGSHHEGVETEWRYAAILSCFNACLDADALSLCAMANASFYQHYPLAPHYTQNPKPTRLTLMAQNDLDREGRVVPRTYVAFYVGDYDSSAWLYHKLPEMWKDPSRGKLPLSWAFDPNLCQRFGFGMAWAYANRTTNDSFVSGDSGAGYLNPGFLTTPRPWSDLPDGLSVWEKRCQHYYQQWDMSLTGFIIYGASRELSPEGFAAYARFSPDGIVTQGGEPTLYGGMPSVRMATDLSGDPAKAAGQILGQIRNRSAHFIACRSVLKTPSWHLRVEEELARRAGDKVKIVDLYTLLQLVRASKTAARP